MTRCILTVLALFCLGTSEPATAQGRIALVIGNSSYRQLPPLTIPTNEHNY